MNVLESTTMVGAGAVLAGFLGALTGLGGGVVIVPLLTLVFGVDIRYAIGASLISVIGTSSGAAAAYVKEGYSNIRIGMLLEVATASGALVGAFVAALVSTSLIGLVFGLVLLYSAYLSTGERHGDVSKDESPDRVAAYLKLNGTYPTAEGLEPYRVVRVPWGFGLMWVAGVLSGLLGIGSGALKVIAMDQVMRIPFKVSTTTSNFMIGVTAAASAGVYFSRGYIDPALSMPVVLGVLLGALLGSRYLMAARTRVLRLVFGAVIVVLGVEMLYNSLAGRL